MRHNATTNALWRIIERIQEIMPRETQYTGHGVTKTLKDMYRLLALAIEHKEYAAEERREYIAYCTIYNTCTDLLETLLAIDIRAEDKPDYNVTRAYSKAYNMALRHLREQKEQSSFVEVKRIYNVAISSLTVAKNNSMK